MEYFAYASYRKTRRKYISFFFVGFKEVIPSLVTGLVVGVIVGIILAKRQKKDRIEEERRREKIFLTDELTNSISNLNKIF